ncbi:VOC family protein [Nocardioides pantholopis]|uniref:VOC family protein n=1 Tax=Nocardioides pantholopis TaxID=2483798 RepID=UPI0013DD9C5F
MTEADGSSLDRDGADSGDGPLRFVAVSLDCGDPDALAQFYVSLLGGELLWSSPASAAVRTPGVTLVAQRVDGYRPPRWPGSSLVHLDLSAGRSGDANSAAVERALGLGASMAADQPDGRWTVLLDPAGHPFCITPFTPES